MSTLLEQSTASFSIAGAHELHAVLTSRPAPLAGAEGA